MKKDEMDGECSTHGRNSYRIVIWKPAGKILIGRPRRRLEGNIKMGLKDIGWEGVDWIHLAQDRDQYLSFVNKGLSVQVL
jgi:hypothetical protein